MMLIESTATFKCSARLRSEDDRVAVSSRNSRRGRAYPPPEGRERGTTVREAELRSATIAAAFYGVIPELVRDEDEELAQCHLSGRWCVRWSHLRREHGLTMDEYTTPSGSRLVRNGGRWARRDFQGEPTHHELVGPNWWSILRSCRRDHPGLRGR